MCDLYTYRPKTDKHLVTLSQSFSPTSSSMARFYYLVVLRDDIPYRLCECYISYELCVACIHADTDFMEWLESEFDWWGITSFEMNLISMLLDDRFTW